MSFVLRCLIFSLLFTACLRAEIPKAERVEVPTPAYARMLEVTKETKRLRDAQDAAGLEALADSLRQGGERMDGTSSMISCFYEVMANLGNDEATQQRRLAFLEKWATVRPENITAQVALAEAYVEYAWEARGSGWAREVTPEGWRLMKERLQKAWDILKKSYTLEKNCPGWYAAAQSVALGQGWKREDYFKLVNDAIAKYPEYGEFYRKACYWLLPRWYGEQGDFEKWIAEMADTYPAEVRDREYARLVWMAHRMGQNEEIVFAPGRLDWERTQKGFAQWMEEKPDNLMVGLEFFSLCLLADDREAARRQLDTMGVIYFPPMWPPQTFTGILRYVYEDGENPLTADREEEISEQSVAQQNPLALLPAETRDNIAVAVGFIPRVLGGFLAGLLLFILAAERRRFLAGTLAFLTSLPIAAFFGTIATILVAAGLWVYLNRVYTSEKTRLPSGWETLGVLALLLVIGYALQFGAVVFLSAQTFLAHPALEQDQLLATVFLSPDFIPSLNSAFWLTFLCLILLIRPQSWASARDLLGLRVPSARWFIVLLWIIGCLAVSTIVGTLLEPFMDAGTEDYLRLLAGSAQAEPWVFLLGVVIIVPLIEEIVIRGYVFSGWLARLGPWLTVLLTSVIFALCHGQYGWSALLSIFILGILLALVRLRTGSVIPCMIIHMGQNLLFALWAFQTEL